MDTAFQVAHNTDQHAYSWRPSDPTILEAFHEFMRSQRASQKPWTSYFPLEMLKLSAEEDRVLLVDVGGATGGQCLLLRQRHPHLTGKMIVQDQESIISKTDSQELESFGIVSQVHDFFQPQPIGNAKAYYLRNILHDWPDSSCINILFNLRGALAPDSMILIDETVLPDIGASWKQTQKDIQMMAGLAAMERSERQWKELLGKAGLKIQGIHIYDEEMGDGVIIAVKA